MEKRIYCPYCGCDHDAENLFFDSAKTFKNDQYGLYVFGEFDCFGCNEKLIIKIIGFSDIKVFGRDNGK